MNITIRQLRLFLELFERKSFTAAASHLCMTQSAASKALAELEAQLGFELFDRTTRRVEPKDSAREFRPFALDIIATLQSATRCVEDVVDLKRGKVSIAALPLMIGGVLSPLIAGYRARHPGIHFDLQEVSTEESLDRVRSGAVDFGLGLLETEVPDLESEVVLENDLWVMMAQDHPLRLREAISLDELTQWEHIKMSRRFNARRALDTLLVTRSLDLPSAIEVDTPTAAFGLARSGAGLLIVPTYAVAVGREWGMHAVPVDDVPSALVPISVFQRRLARPSLAARSFLAELHATLRPSPQAIAP